MTTNFSYTPTDTAEQKKENTTLIQYISTLGFLNNTISIFMVEQRIKLFIVLCVEPGESLFLKFAKDEAPILTT